MSEDLCYLTIAEAGRLYRQRKLSPVEVTQAYLDRIQALDPRVNAYITVDAEQAMASAHQAEAELAGGHDRGLLHGAPIAVKDLMNVKGLPTTAASRVRRDEPVATRDATVVARLKQAGAVLLGKLNLHEFAYGGPAQDSAYPIALNPWDTTRSPGGSSSGSAVATALGLAMGTLGTDTGGSIRTPACLCGVVGLKPTFGRVSRAGVIPLSWSLDHVGPLTRSVADAATLLECIAGYDESDPWSARAPIPDMWTGLGDGVAGVRIGLPRDLFFDPTHTHPEVLEAVEKAVVVLRGLGATTTEVSIPLIHLDYAAGVLILFAEAYTHHERDLRERPELYGEGLRNRFRAGAFVTARDYLQAYRVRALLKHQFQRVFEQVDVLATPTMPQPAGPFHPAPGGDGAWGPRILRPFNMAGLPGITVPCGFSSQGLPMGLHIAGRPYDEPTVLRVAHAYEQATDWHTRRPAITQVGAR